MAHTIFIYLNLFFFTVNSCKSILTFTKYFTTKPVSAFVTLLYLIAITNFAVTTNEDRFPSNLPSFCFARFFFKFVRSSPQIYFGNTALIDKSSQVLKIYFYKHYIPIIGEIFVQNKSLYPEFMMFFFKQFVSIAIFFIVLQTVAPARESKIMYDMFSITEINIKKNWWKVNTLFLVNSKCPTIFFCYQIKFFSFHVKTPTYFENLGVFKNVQLIMFVRSSSI